MQVETFPLTFTEDEICSYVVGWENQNFIYTTYNEALEPFRYLLITDKGE